MAEWEITSGSLATPLGFQGAALAAGIKKSPGTLDLALIFSESSATACAGLFTTNLAAAAPVVYCRRSLEASKGWARAIVANAGNANACTGKPGRRLAEDTARVAAKQLGIPVSQVLLASTGVIGIPLKPELILSNLPRLHATLSAESAALVPQAIMTTDTFPKLSVLRGRVGGETVHLAGTAKGAGMIHPRMATMLAFITSDVEISPRDLKGMLSRAVKYSFNRLTVDGDTSTNDTVIVLANGLSGVKVRSASPSGEWFQAGLTKLCQALARMIARDGEGSKKLLTVEVEGARTEAEADRVARAIANSPLVKTAIAGSDPNWGRILCAVGYSGAQFNPDKVDIAANGFLLCRKGLDAGFTDVAAKEALNQEEVALRVSLRQGKASATIWTCDLTRDYISINASYRT